MNDTKRFILQFILILSIAFGLISFCEKSKADSIYLGAWSDHYSDRENVRNETHNLFAYEHEKWIAGTYNNSYKDQTFFAGYKAIDLELGKFNIGVYGGLSYGYKNCKKGNPQDMHKPAVVCLMGVPELTHDNLNFTVGKIKIQPAFVIIANAYALSFKGDF